ncbi:MAG: hypothetical protein E6Q50_11900 [Lysobacter sp.]|nr:MAG: hypothetical protein E6Q50_11900 [Lysobacter sp.]
MNMRLNGLICRFGYAAGISIAVYNAVRVSQMYKSVRDYGAGLTTAHDSDAYAVALQNSPSSVDTKIFLIFIGFILMLISEYCWNILKKAPS